MFESQSVCPSKWPRLIDLYFHYFLAIFKLEIVTTACSSLSVLVSLRFLFRYLGEQCSLIFKNDTTRPSFFSFFFPFHNLTGVFISLSVFTCWLLHLTLSLVLPDLSPCHMPLMFSLRRVQLDFGAVLPAVSPFPESRWKRLNEATPTRWVLTVKAGHLANMLELSFSVWKKKKAKQNRNSGTPRGGKSYSWFFCTTQQMMNEKLNQVLLLVGETNF